MKPSLGLIGLGDMGAPIAERLLRSGYSLTVHDANQDVLSAFATSGAICVGTAHEVASRAEVVFACLPSPAVSEEVALGEGGVAAGSRVKQYVELSTIGVATMERISTKLAVRGVETLDAPLSGGPSGVREGNLTCFVAASQAAYETVEPILRVLADRLFHVGSRPGQSQVLKLANNALTTANLSIAVEMVLMARKAGIDEAVAIDVINASSGRNRATEVTYKRQILSGAFNTGARLEILAKDMSLVVETAAALGVEHSVADAVSNLWQAALDDGYGGEDITRIYDFVVATAPR